MMPKTTLDHWNVFKAVAEQGSFHKAADHLGRSQSTISYAMNKLQEQLGVSLIEIRGRKAELTTIGEMLLEDGRAMVEGMLQIEGRARSLASGHELKVRLCVEHGVPPERVLQALQDFRSHFPNTLIDVAYLTTSSIQARFLERSAELYLMSQPPAGAFGNELCQIRLICVASPHHPLAGFERPISRKDLALSQVIKCDDASSDNLPESNSEAFTSAVIWRFNQPETVMSAIHAGLGYGWVPEWQAATALDAGTLVPLNLAEGAQRRRAIELVHRNRHGAGPATMHLANALMAQFGSPSNGDPVERDTR